MFTTRALLAQHQTDCREDRQRTNEQFKAMDEKIKDLGHSVEKLDAKIDAKHRENTEKLDKISRYIWLAVGAMTIVSFLLTHEGHALLKLVGG